MTDKTQADIPEADRLGNFAHPREVADLFGQAVAEQALFDGFMGGRMHHAWLLSGPRGIGKATLAYRMARFVLKYGDKERAAAMGVTDLSVPESDPVFSRVAALGHPDLAVLRRPYDFKTKRLKTVIPVEEVRRATGMFSKSAGEGGWRICIIDSVDEMNPNAANALLKILEEPPTGGLFLLVAHQPGRLLPTIRSRCRQLTLASLTAPDIAQVLAANGVATQGPEREATAFLADGSAGRALEISAGGGLELYRDMIGLLASLPDLDGAMVHQIADKVGRRGAEASFQTFMVLLGERLARLARDTAIGAPAGEIELIAGEQALMTRLGGLVSLDRLVEVWEKIGQMSARTEALNMDRKLVILNAFSLLETVVREGSGAVKMSA